MASRDRRILNTTKNTVLGERIRVAETSLSRMVGLLGKGAWSPERVCSFFRRRRFILWPCGSRLTLFLSIATGELFIYGRKWFPFA